MLNDQERFFGRRRQAAAAEPLAAEQLAQARRELDALAQSPNGLVTDSIAALTRVVDLLLRVLERTS